MEDTYRGESPAKKYARYRCWTTIAQDMTSSAFAKGKHLVLASREGGDIATLLAFDVEPKNIIAVEHNPSAAHAVQEKYPAVRVVCRDVVKMSQECKRTLSSAYLDFCGTATDSLLRRVCQVVLHGLKDDAYLAVTVLSGREQGELREEILARKSKPLSARRFHSLSDRSLVEEMISGIRGNEQGTGAQEYRARLKHALLSPDPEALRTEAARIRATQEWLFAEKTSPLVRMHYLREELLPMLEPHRVTLHPLEMLHYNSNTHGANGVPMCIVVFKVRRFTRTTPTRKFKWYSNRFHADSGATRIVDCNMDEPELRRAVLSMERIIAEDQAAGRLRDSELSLVERLALTFNLPKETIIAWKAHRTRGTYEQESQ